MVNLEADEGSVPPTSAEAAEYLADMIRELEELARQHGHRVLGQILELARLEAERSTRASDRGLRREDRQIG